MKIQNRFQKLIHYNPFIIPCNCPLQRIYNNIVYHNFYMSASSI